MEHLQNQELLCLVEKNVILGKEFKLLFFSLDCNQLFSSKVLFEEYKNALNVFKEQGYVILKEKVFGSRTAYQDLTKIRKASSENSFLSTFIEYESISNAPVSCIAFQVLQSNHKDVEVRYISETALELVTPSFSRLYMGGHQSSINEDDDRYKVFENAFIDIETTLKSCNYSPNDIYRTWFYINEINDYYVSFNKARIAFFDEFNILYTGESNDLPSSTGIGKFADDREQMVYNLEALKVADGSIQKVRIYNDRQNEANGASYLFSPTFARGMKLSCDLYEEIHISGTASIDGAGATVYKDDPFEHIKYTMLNVQAILTQSNLGFEDIAESTCFFKNQEYFEIYKQVLEELQIEEFSNTFVIGDVCRDDLLFELDGIAIKNKG